VHGKVVQYGAFSEAYQDLVNRRLDAVIHNIVSLSTLVNEKPDVFVLGSGWAISHTPHGPCRKGTRA